MGGTRGEARLLAALRDCRLVNIDTNALVYYLDDRLPYADLMEAVFRRVRRGEMKIVISSVAQMELLVKPIKDRDITAIDAVIGFTEQTANMTVVDVSRPVVMQAARLRAEGLPVADSLILATGLVMECNAIITNDGGWRRIVDTLKERSPIMPGDVPLSMPKVLYLNDYV